MEEEGPTVAQLAEALDTCWVLLGAVMVFFMQAGFAMLEVGSVSIKNTKNILIKNIGDSAMGSLAWWLVGHGVAFGEDWGGFIGTSGFALKGEALYGTASGEYDARGYAAWLFQWAFATTATTIVSGAMAERSTFGSYVLHSSILVCCIYPVVVHWVWSEDGWASSSREGDLLVGCGALDFAGSGVVHVVGGLSALVGITVLGPRAGRFNEDGTSNAMPEQSAVLQTLGTFILWWGWLGFNGASVASFVEKPAVVAKTMIATIIAGASGGMTSLVLHKIQWGWWDTVNANNGILGGLVSVTAGAAAFEPEAAFVIGALGGAVYFLSARLLLRMKVDDVVNAAPVHLFCGVWGLIAAPLFTSKLGYAAAYDAARANTCAGLFYGGGWRALAANLLFGLALLTWTGISSLVLFVTAKLTVGLRVPKQQELDGLDDSKHGGRTFQEPRSKPRAVRPLRP